MKVCRSLLFMLLGIRALAYGQSPASGGGWTFETTPAWSDEFNYNGLPDSTKWGYDIGGRGWGNNELQYYTNSIRNAEVKNGVLAITARKEEKEGRHYTSARLITKHKGDFLYGRFEIRARLPAGKGTWPAIWMLPTDWEYGGWPNSGEIDIMEHVGYDPDNIHISTHSKAYYFKINTQKTATRRIRNATTQFHRYRVDWTPDSLKGYIDDELVFAFGNERKTYQEWPFDKRFHLLLNVAVGGDWGGAKGVDDNIFPAAMQVDYVRVYRFIPPEGDSIACWLTTPDRQSLFSRQDKALVFGKARKAGPVITVDDSKTFQGIDGFGYTLTGGSASLINALPAEKKHALLRELFLKDSTHIGVSYLRISVGASDLSDTTFTYDEMPPGQTDEQLAHFSIEREKKDLLPVLQQIVALNPSIKILGSPWTAPTWMKSNSSFKGGSLQKKYYGAYAQYFVKYIKAMQEAGVRIDAITPQNEPLHGGNVPSMVMQAEEQADFIGNYLGPAFREAGISTKIIVYDHNADRPDYPLTILGNAKAAPFVDGSAFHLYGGPITALTQVHNAFPEKNIYFTEQWVGGPGTSRKTCNGM